MGVTIRKPTARQCENCGRKEVWNDATGTWRVARDDDGERIAGNVYCIHEWDINGTFVPIEMEGNVADADVA
ncbi:MAG: HEWD family protein [Haloplanus sp.]